MATTVEAPNIYHGKVPADCIKRYLNLHHLEDAIILDILVHNHPSDTNSVGARNMKAIFDIKTLRIDKNEDFYKEIGRRFRRAVDTKVLRVRRSYMLKAEELDINCGANCTTHTFSEALKNNFNSGGVHQVVFGVGCSERQMKLRCGLLRSVQSIRRRDVKTLMLHLSATYCRNESHIKLC